MTGENIDALVRRRGFALRRGRTDPERLWLVTGEDQLFTRAGGMNEQQVRDLLALRVPERQTV